MFILLQRRQGLTPTVQGLEAWKRLPLLSARMVLFITCALIPTSIMLPSNPPSHWNPQRRGFSWDSATILAQAFCRTSRCTPTFIQEPENYFYHLPQFIKAHGCSIQILLASAILIHMTDDVRKGAADSYVPYHLRIFIHKAGLRYLDRQLGSGILSSGCRQNPDCAERRSE